MLNCTNSNCGWKRQATYQDVVGLDVPVDEAHLVDAVDGTNQFRDVEPGRWASYSSKNPFHEEEKEGNKMSR